MRALDIYNRILQGTRLHWSEIAAWGGSDDIELRGAAFQALTAETAIIEGAVDRDEANSIIIEYLFDFLSGNAGEPTFFKMQPYVAGHSLARMYQALRGQEPRPEATLTYIRERLVQQYLQGNERQKRLVVDGALEHIFEEVVCREDFATWKEHPELGTAFAEALDWNRAR